MRTMLSTLLNVLTPPRTDFLEQPLLDQRYARLRARQAAQVAQARAARVAERERLETARVIADRERRAAEMGSRGRLRIVS
jgi:hypothetical protein